MKTRRSLYCRRSSTSQRQDATVFAPRRPHPRPPATVPRHGLSGYFVLASSHTQLGSVARIARESVSAMSDIVWAINPTRDSLLDVVRRMRRHAEEVFAAGNVSLAFAAPETDGTLRVGISVRRDLFLIFKEAVNNAARHSRCTHVAIDLRAEGSWLELRVVDDGIGFDAAAESDGQGLASIRRRAEKIGGTIEVESHPGQGTTVRLRVPCTRSRGLRS